MTRAGISPAAFEELVVRYHLDLVRLAYAMCGDRSMAEDAAQACWQAAWRSRTEIRDPERIQSWLFTVTANEVRRQLRRQGLARVLHGRLTAPPSYDPDPRFSDLARALSKLDLRDRRLIALKYGLGQTSDEIGRQLGLSAVGTRRRLQSVLARLRGDLGEDLQ